MKLEKNSQCLIVLLLLFISIFLTNSYGNSLESVNFYQKGETSYLNFSFNEAGVKASKLHIKEDKQIIIDFEDSSAGDKVLRAFDTSEFSGAIVFVSGYKKKIGKKEGIRVVIQLRDNVRSILRDEGKRVFLEVENRFGVFTKGESGKDQIFKTTQKQKSVGRGLSVPKSGSLVDILENITMSGRKGYVGKRISFNLKQVKVEDVLKMLADASGFNIIITDDIKKLAPMSLYLVNTPWDQVLDVVLGLNKLVAKKNGIILMIKTLAKETKDQKLEIEAIALREKEEPLVTTVFPISFAKLADLKTIISEYLTKNRGRATSDERTNSLIIKDVTGTIEKIRKIVELLDTQTPQVLIESKIVEMTESYKKQIGLQNGINFDYDPITVPGLASSTPTSGIESQTGAQQAGTGFSIRSAPSDGTNLFGVTIGRFNRLINLNFKLQLMESESKGKIVASPRVVTQNKQPAKIETSFGTSYSTRPAGSTTDTEATFATITARLSLEVTPQITNDGSISLEISINKEHFGFPPEQGAPPDKFSRSINTNVLVDNGSTVVLGGIYNFQKTESHAGIPFLKDIPLVGWLFRSMHNPSTTKEEMIIFITPRIINQAESGIETKS